MKSNSLKLYLVALLFAGSQPLANAQSNVLEEIVVTARKKSESLQDVPISISVTSGEEIQKQGLRDLQAVVATLPAVNLSKGGAGAFINVRGVGSGENSGFEQSVGFVIDNVAHGRSRATRAGLLDLERVEVLKGPQTTYFGANTIAGVVNVTTRGPSLDESASGYVSASYETETEEKVIEGAVNIPVSDTFALRLAGKVLDSDGYILNQGLNRTEPATEDELFRVSALWSPSDNFTAELKYTSVNTKANSGLDVELNTCRPGGPAQFNCIQRDGSPVDSGINYVKSTDIEEFRELDLDSLSLNLKYDVGDYTLTSVTGSYEFDNEFLIDLDVSSVPSLFAPSRFSLNQLDTAEHFSQEFRISSPVDGAFSWDAGIYYQDEEVSFSNVLVVAFSPPVPVPPGAQAGARSFQDSETTSVFAAASYDFSDRLTATLGARYIEVEKTVRQSPVQPGPLTANRIPDAQALAPFGGGFRFSTESREDDDFLPSVDLKYQFSENTNLYGSFRQGFKAGGYSLANPPQGQMTNFIQGFDPETVDAFELGLKGTYFDSRLDLNIALFSMEFDDRQVSSLAEGGTGLTQAVANAATSTTTGVEVDFSALLSDRWSMKGALTLMDSTFDDFVNAPCYTGQSPALGCINGVQNLSGKTTTHAPDYSGSLTLRYEVPLSGYMLSIEPNIVVSDGYALISDLNPLNFQPSWSKLNLRIGLVPESSAWELALVGRNLNDETTSHFCQEAPAAPPGVVSCAPDAPATYMLQGRYSF